MARYVIVCAFDRTPPDELAAALELTDRLTLGRNEDRPDVRICWSSFQQVEARLAAALAAGQVGSAALLPSLPPPDQRWILTEWRGRLAVHSSIADQLDQRFWDVPASYDLIDLQVFASTCVEPGQSTAESTAISGGRLAEWVETTAEYRASLETDRPTLITAHPLQILTKMRDWFGELADERVGGAIAILGMSGVTPSATSQVVLRNPAALGLRRATGTTTLAGLCAEKRVTVQAWGTSSDDPTRVLAPPRPEYTRMESRSLTAEFTTLKESTRARYGVLIKLAAGALPEITIDAGTVFEQEALNRVQNLAIAAGSVIAASVGGGGSVTRALPAWCLNRRLAPPSGQQVRPTSLFVPVVAGINQGTVWSIVERSLSGLGPSEAPCSQRQP